MDLILPFVTQSGKRKKKKSKPETTRVIKIRNDYAPIDIQNMSMPELEYLYEHGTPTQKEIAEHVMLTRKKFETATMVPDDILASGAPTSSGSPSTGLRW